jgi:hypothetical protein
MPIYCLNNRILIKGNMTAKATHCSAIDNPDGVHDRRPVLLDYISGLLDQPVNLI